MTKEFMEFTPLEPPRNGVQEISEVLKPEEVWRV